MNRSMHQPAMALLTFWSFATLLPAAPAQGVPQSRKDAVLIVEGVVREIFRSARRYQSDILVEIAVDDARIGPQSRNRGRVIVPAQGESVYVHLQELPGGLGHRTPPVERSKIRAYLEPRNQGGWVGSFPDWFEVTSNELAQTSPDDPAPAADAKADVAAERPVPRPAGALDSLGVGGDVVSAGGDRIVVRITSVRSGGPADAAGIEEGDVIIGAADSPLTSLDDLAAILRDNAPAVPVIVVGKGQQRATQVKVNIGGGSIAGRVPADAGRPERAPDAPVPPRSAGGAVPRLGASLESVPVNGKPGWKITRLTEGGPAQQAGFELGDLIVGIDGRVVDDLESLNQALARSGGQSTLTVRDVRTGKSVPVRVVLETAAGTTKPANRPNIAPASAGPLGVSVESVDVDQIPTLRITRVERGSPAERAGLRVGDVVEAVNDTIVFNPEEFASLVNQSTGTIELILKKAGDRQKIQVPLSGR